MLHVEAYALAVYASHTTNHTPQRTGFYTGHSPASHPDPHAVSQITRKGHAALTNAENQSRVHMHTTGTPETARIRYTARAHVTGARIASHNSLHPLHKSRRNLVVAMSVGLRLWSQPAAAQAFCFFAGGASAPAERLPYSSVVLVRPRDDGNTHSPASAPSICPVEVMYSLPI